MNKIEPWKDLVLMFSGKWAWVGYASLLCVLCFTVVTLAQFIKCLKTRNTTALSLAFAILLPVTNTVLLIYNIFLFIVNIKSDIFNWAILISMVFNGLLPAYATMFMKIKHVRAAKKLNLTEIQYYEQYLSPKIKRKKSR